ncbi:Ig-like and fibronectin type-III domain-containing protein 2 [Harmonia axyridis]|uniref:Ig-like and fibronectin type-III domain-containing protein 2 n=1 Tax=Harmonia axyridis TaxID=115357 RepID=UPI001E277D47|nr:Ig-like and fibronectin type-III domain-containing protein 2 [Harmonia axyridis]XP_045478485.1 Ig-like and fibronectin type-III domain-containing protein 2 [Harmonia axyridis]
MWILLFLSLTGGLTSGLPSMRDSLTNPVHVHEGDDALITCVVKDVGENTVMWKKEDRERHSARVLTAGTVRVTADKRYVILHDAESMEETSVPSGGDVWVLLIKQAKTTDSGIYVCEVNSNPIVRSFHKLSVVSKALQPPANMTDSSLEPKTPFSSRNHNYTDCCQMRNVSSNCLGFCNIQSILEGSTGQDPENCEVDFPSIVKCMADGRNHVPCCIQERVPDICQDVCRGTYTEITDNIKTHFSCSAYTEQTLACIVEGIELLPSQPEELEVEALNEKSIKVMWEYPYMNAETVTQFSVNVTSLHTFDERIEPIHDNPPPLPTSISTTMSHAIHLNVKAPQKSIVINDLVPFTMYEVTVTAVNKHGSSLPSYAVRTLTLTPTKVQQKEVGEAPKLPDIKTCCRDKGISHPPCINKLCDPTETASAEITDLMICAPWAPATFSCLTQGLDHTPCCKERGLPDLCQQLCMGNVSSIDFNYLKCMRYMSEYTNCLLQGYGVLPSAPIGVHLTNVETEFAIIHWDLPKTLGDTVTGYRVHLRKFDGDDGEYSNHFVNHGPFVLEGLESNTDYEVYVEAVNTHGVGTPSTRITFRTESKVIEEELEEASTYNVTACCIEADLSNVCLPLCSYDANMSDIKQLAAVCASEFHKLLRCGAGGRNHGACCERRGVPSNCLSLCAGVIVTSLAETASKCITYIGNIVQCFEEGTGILPGPIAELHATVVDSHSVLLEWEPPQDGSNITSYIVNYQKVDNTSMHETLLKLDQQVEVNSTTATLTGLEKKGTYHIFVVSKNRHGTSLPSSIIVITLIKADSQWVKGVIFHPHSLAVASHSATWVTITWQPPEFSHPSDQITYSLYYKKTSDDDFHIVNTTVTTHPIMSLEPNTQYIVYVKAMTDKGASMPSETLIAWTDPAYPAVVEAPTVHPINLVIEGSSMTILCIAMGTPMPTISLYITGRLVRQETTRHMVTVIHNVTKDMNQISCYADNGYGTPMQASKKITISHGPHIQASGITMAILGDSVTLECKVDAQPEPKMIFWRNHEERTPVIQGGKYDIVTAKVKEEEDKYIMQLTIKQIQMMDVGDYFCHAENAFGSTTQAVSVRLRNIKPVKNITQCCKSLNVSSPCMDACSFYMDIDSVINKLECVNDFEKLMKCASDGSDHRNCCVHSGVQRLCLDWCRGEPVINKKICTLSYTKQIINCFHENQDKLPGPPQNARTEFIDAHTVKIVWDPPVKNPHTVEIYRVIWRLLDGKQERPVYKNDTPETSLVLTNLKEGGTYEYVIKAGNNKGTSVLTKSVRFITGDKDVTASANHSSGGNHMGVAVAVILAIIGVILIVCGAVYLVRNKKLLKGTNGVAFENPSYLREVNMDHIQVPQGQNDSTISNGGSNGLAVSSASGGLGWKNEQLHVPQSQEVNPTLYEELKLGQDGAGFKRLKP